jgi:hypothetical protein
MSARNVNQLIAVVDAIKRIPWSTKALQGQ